MRTERNDVAISITDSAVPSGSLSIAVVGDLHLPEGAEHLSKLRALLMEVKSAEPDLIDLFPTNEGKCIRSQCRHPLVAMFFVFPFKAFSFNPI